MKFDRTHGKEAMYMVSIYAFNVQDQYYFHYFKDAKKFFDEMLQVPQGKGVVISIWDIKNDIRKAFKKY